MLAWLASRLRLTASSPDDPIRSAPSPPEGLDWPLIVLFTGFAIAMPWRSTLRLMLPPPAPETASPFADYEHALRDAAVKHPAYRHALRTIDTPEADLVAFLFARPKIADNTLAGDVWAALPDELRQACADAANPTLRLEQFLGLPPRSGPFHIFPIHAKRDDIFRPCMSGDGPTAPFCDFTLPKGVAGAPAAPERPADGQADEGSQNKGGAASATQGLADAYRKLVFVAQQIWTVQRSEFPASYARRDDYPFDGYPFTGMGWTYDWDPGSLSHFGATEFIIRKGAAVSIGDPMDPARFCTAAGG